MKKRGKKEGRDGGRREPGAPQVACWLSGDRIAGPRCTGSLRDWGERLGRRSHPEISESVCPVTLLNSMPRF